jgi:hypothetical protein
MTDQEMVKLLTERVKNSFYKGNIKADDIVKQLAADPDLKLDAEKAKRFVYITLHIEYKAPEAKK